jgi:hypothetical protein
MCYSRCTFLLSFNANRLAAFPRSLVASAATPVERFYRSVTPRRDLLDFNMRDGAQEGVDGNH